MLLYTFACLVTCTSKSFIVDFVCFEQLDGYVARRMGINSVVGSYLDPLADKVSALSSFKRWSQLIGSYATTDYNLYILVHAEILWWLGHAYKLMETC